jgi:hypothetical protein
MFCQFLLLLIKAERGPCAECTEIIVELHPNLFDECFLHPHLVVKIRLRNKQF